MSRAASDDTDNPRQGLWLRRTSPSPKWFAISNMEFSTHLVGGIVTGGHYHLSKAADGLDQVGG
ncbi:hypothetical protein CDL15_Pgr012037 [Punica granatum]|uniref:Uncharacterized protein n=1 Tax=Punica granatum TaxID=22663 RepID=A0A218XLC5_PUNGR|nr:hypothetical protein CDL15_Pgr012037 [Punica granatum]